MARQESIYGTRLLPRGSRAAESEAGRRERSEG
eukprot:COSAG01_NODE_10693_length_2103_cov_44.977545_1_plen_32_part_10